MSERTTSQRQTAPSHGSTPVGSSLLQRRSADGAEPSAVPPIVHEVLGSPGQPLDAETRAFMEPRFGHDFGRVRVHADGKAAESAREVNALAYTVGDHVAFAPGRFAPATVPGQRLLAHELAHVVQQREVIGTEPIAFGPTDALAEREAHSAAGVVLSGGAPRPLASISDPVLRRADDDEGWMETASEYWGDIKERAYKAMIDNMRLAQSRGLRQLRDLAREMPPVQRFLAEQIVTQVEIATDLLISLILAVVGLAVGLVSGLAKALWGLLQVVYGLLYGLILFVAGFFSESRRAEFDEKANAVIEALKNLPSALRTLMDRWKAEWDRANPDRKTLMIGELTGEIEAILVTALLGGHVAGQAPKVTATLVPAHQFATAGGGSLMAGGLTVTVDVAGPPTAGALTAAMAMSIDESAKRGAGEKEIKAPEDTGAKKESRVEPYEKEVDRPYERLEELRRAREEFADEFAQRSLPPKSKVSTRKIERTEAGRAQAAQVTPEESAVAMDVELDITLPDGTRFKPDGVRYVDPKRYLFREHKEVLTIWEKSHFSKDIARRELEIMLEQRADIYTKLKKYGCAGFEFTTNNENLANLLAELISQMKVPGREGLLAPPL
jgi:hypothetical protein